MLHNLDTIYYKPDLVRISQQKLISARTCFWFTEVGQDMLFDISFIADWKLLENRQHQTDCSNKCENNKRVDYD